MTRNSTIDEVTFVTILWVCQTISFFFIAIRLALQYHVGRKWHTSDILILVAWLFSLGNGIAWSVFYKQMYQVIALAKTPTINFSEVPANIEWMQRRYLNGQLSAYLLSFTGLWLIKLSFVFFFRQLGNRYRAQQILWWVVLVLVIGCYGGTLGCLDYKCEMSSLEYSIEVCATAGAMHSQQVRLRVATTLDILSDAAIIVLSGNVLWRARVNLTRKLALIGVSFLTAFIIIIALLRLFLSVSDMSIIDPIWLGFWNALEICVAIVVACLASFWTFYTKSKRSPSPSDIYRRESSPPNRNYASLEAPILLAGDMSETDKNPEPAVSVQSLNSRQGADACHVSHV
ncbi:hypothetical protein BDV24DRAFT_132423 [Aspergillus arachidicola]|uniref:Rhodopsin domain-containing protein n=1 Tax=Aspergillus arachidicola TaxID=656916 RepID=A0A2G7G1N9_9EURO|nr:hypothetical protein BDV24DRAFT_132423 [Aspergillus arachidicola]PIG86722.1 hypothetical protein AARAC_010737 [Aspergillus arachidicola]